MNIIKLYGIETTNWCTNCTSSLNSSSFQVSVYRVYGENECAQPEEKEATIVVVNINKQYSISTGVPYVWHSLSVG
jgi:hypothetical protein